jgi:hypothetical protein
MVTKQLIKTEIDNVQDEYLEALFKIVKAFGARDNSLATVPEKDQDRLWQTFIQDTYGSFADDQMKRGDQGRYEAREPIE